jgi:hypothetical protein
VAKPAFSLERRTTTVKKSLVAIIAAGTGILALAAPSSAAPHRHPHRDHHPRVAVESGCEIVRVSGRSGRSFTVTIGEDGATATVPGRGRGARHHHGRWFARGTWQVQCPEAAPAEEPIVEEPVVEEPVVEEPVVEEPVVDGVTSGGGRGAPSDGVVTDGF